MAYNFGGRNNNNKKSVNTNSKIFKNYTEGEFNVALKCTFWDEKLKVQFVPKKNNVQSNGSMEDYFEWDYAKENKCPSYIFTETNLQAFIEGCEKVLEDGCKCERTICRESSKSETPSYIEVSNRNAVTGDTDGLFLNVYTWIKDRDVNDTNTYTYQFAGETTIYDFNTVSEEVCYSPYAQFKEFIQLLKEFQRSLLNASAHSTRRQLNRTLEYQNSMIEKLMNSQGLDYYGNSQQGGYNRYNNNNGGTNVRNINDYKQPEQSNLDADGTFGLGSDEIPF